MYTSRRRGKVWYLKAPPRKPPTYPQKIQRAKFTAAADAWKLLAPAQRDLWRLATRRAHLRIGGYALWIAYRTTHNSNWLATIERQAHLTLPTS